MIYVDRFKHYYYSIFVDIIFDYKEQIFITRIKKNIQHYMYLIFLQKQNNLTNHGNYGHINLYCHSLRSNKII